MEGLDVLSRLTELNLAENAIDRIDHVDALTQLVKLNLSGNRIQRIPKSISRLTNLNLFRIARNRVSILNVVNARCVLC